MADAQSAVPLDSSRWSHLATRMGAEGEWVRDALRALLASPSDLDVFTEMWPEICSEDITYDAAYAAAPYLVACAERAPAGSSVEYLIVLGLIETYSTAVPEDLEPAYRQALKDALSLALQRLGDAPTDHTLRYVMGAVAAFRGRRDLARVLVDIDLVQAPCPSCGQTVYPGELEQIAERDKRESRRLE